jgi:hypothetical protein
MNRTQEVVNGLLDDGQEEVRRFLEVFAQCITGVDKIHKELEARGDIIESNLEFEDDGMEAERREVGEAMRIARLMKTQFEMYMSRRIKEGEAFVANNTAFNLSIQKYSRINNDNLRDI